MHFRTEDKRLRCTDIREETTLRHVLVYHAHFSSSVTICLDLGLADCVCLRYVDAWTFIPISCLSNCYMRHTLFFQQGHRLCRGSRETGRAKIMVLSRHWIPRAPDPSGDNLARGRSARLTLSLLRITVQNLHAGKQHVDNSRWNQSRVWDSIPNLGARDSAEIRSGFQNCVALPN